MEPRHTYRVIATREDECWFVEVPDCACASLAQSVGGIGFIARRLVAVMTGQDPRAVRIVMEWVPRDTPDKAGLKQWSKFRHIMTRNRRAAANVGHPPRASTMPWSVPGRCIRPWSARAGTKRHCRTELNFRATQRCWGVGSTRPNDPSMS